MPKDDWYQLFPAKGGAVHLILTAQGFGMGGAPGMQQGAYGAPQAGYPQAGYGGQPQG